MKTSKKQREQENKILAKNAIKSYEEKLIPFWHVMDGVNFIYDTNLQKKHNDEVINRVFSGLFYTTLYGIGFWYIFSGSTNQKELVKMKEYLNNKNIKFYNEFSDAKWVYRFVINKEVNIHNELLNNYTKQ